MAAPVDFPIERQNNLPSDPELIAAVNRGDMEAFEVLYHRHRDWVVNLAYRFTGDRDLALDVLQETFLYFAMKFPGFRLTANLKTFLYPAVRNLSIGIRRKTERYQTSDADRTTLDSLAAPAPCGEPDTLVVALASLSVEHREALLLRFVDGLTLLEIAAALNIPLGTVKSRLHNAVVSLRNDPRTKTFFTP